MFWLIACLIILDGGLQSSAIGADEKHVIAQDSLYIITECKSALSASILKQQFNWASVNDDGKSLKIITTDCNVIEKRPNEITPAEMSALQQVANSGSPSQSVLLSGTRLSQSSGPYIGGYVNQFNYSDVTAQFIGQNHRMISSPSLRAANVQRLSVDDDLVTLIFQDDTLLMKPKSCLDASAQQLLSSAESELAKAKAKWELDSQTQGIRLNYDVPQIESDEQTKRYQAQAEENARNYQAEMQRYAQQVRADAQEYARQIRNYYSRY